MYTERPDYQFFRVWKRIPREEVEARIMHWIRYSHCDPAELCEFYNKMFPNAQIGLVFTMDYQRTDFCCVDESQDANDNPMHKKPQF